MIELSVIVPIYNAELYIEECLLSLVKILDEHTEILLVDDGSTDSSYSICKKYLRHNIKVFKNCNHGVSYTRNFGLSKARGKYVCFIDSDDFLNYNFADEIKKNLDFDYDLISFGYNVCDKRKTIGCYGELISNEISHNIFFNNAFNGYVWNKIFKLDIIKKNNINFNTDITYCEDLLFLVDYSKYVDKIKNINKPLYNYRIRKSSTSGNFYNKNNNSLILAYEDLLNRYTTDNIVRKRIEYLYLISLRKFKIKNVDIYKRENEILKQCSFSEKIKYFILKYFFNVYLILRKIKGLQQYE